MFPRELILIVFLGILLGASTVALCDNGSSGDNSSFTPTDKLPGATVAHSAVVLANGDVLVTGGYGMLFGKLPLVTNLAQIYDHQAKPPDSQKQQFGSSWRVAKVLMNYGRFCHTALRLPCGKVVIVGGLGQHKKPLRSVELFDPATEKFHILPSMAVARRNPRLNLLPGGRLLITGQSQLAEIIEPLDDPAHRQGKSDPDGGPRDGKSPPGYLIRPARGKLRVKHSDHATVTLPDGSVVLFGGRTTYIERFDPHTETFQVCKARLPKVYDDQAAVLLYNGKILLAGGQEVYSNRCTDRTWIYDIRSDALREGPRLNATAAGDAQPGASDIRAVDLFAHDKNRQGRYIFLCGGEYDPGIKEKPDIILDSAWIYDAIKNRLLNVGPMLTGHDDFAAVPLPPLADFARALIIAGHGPGDSFQSDCEIFSWKWNFNPPAQEQGGNMQE